MSAKEVLKLLKKYQKYVELNLEKVKTIINGLSRQRIKIVTYRLPSLSFK